MSRLVSRTMNEQHASPASHALVEWPPPALGEVASRPLDREMGPKEPSWMAKDNHVLDKTRLCKYYASGKCVRGQACSFAHGRKQLRPQPNLYRTQICLDFTKVGVCSFGADCRYAHSLREMRFPDFAVPPTAPPPSRRPVVRASVEAEVPCRVAAGGRPVVRASVEVEVLCGVAADLPPAEDLARELELVRLRARSLQAQIDALGDGGGPVAQCLGDGQGAGDVGRTLLGRIQGAVAGGEKAARSMAPCLGGIAGA